MVPEVRTVGSVHIVDLKGRITHGSGDVEMKETIQHLIEEGKKHYLVNMEKVSFMDSAGLGELVACYKRTVENGGVMKILKPNEKVLDLFTITRLIEVFDIFDNEKDALKSY